MPQHMYDEVLKGGAHGIRESNTLLMNRRFHGLHGLQGYPNPNRNPAFPNCRPKLHFNCEGPLLAGMPPGHCDAGTWMDSSIDMTAHRDTLAAAATYFELTSAALVDTDARIGNKEA